VTGSWPSRAAHRRALLPLIAALTLSCGATPQPTGYWEGKGTAMEKPMNDAVRKLTRQAEFEFWFTLAESGDALGEIELKYDAELKVDGLPNVSAPVPGGTISFAPEVGGTLTDLDPTRRFPLVGIFDGETLVLAVATPEADREPLEFTIRADAGISGGLDVGRASVGGLSAGEAQIIIHKIDMTPFSPFGAAVPVEKRPGGPFAVSYEDRGESHVIEWSARQMGGENRQLELSPELESALQRLRQELGTG